MQLSFKNLFHNECNESLPVETLRGERQMGKIISKKPQLRFPRAGEEKCESLFKKMF